MTQNRQIFLSLVRSSLWGTPAEIPADTDWNEMMILAVRQTLAVLLSEAVQKLPDDRKPSSDIISQLFGLRVRNIKAHALINRKLVETVTLLNTNGIRTVLLKGQGLARNYQDPLLRQCGDIDLYVGDADYRRAHDVAVEAFGSHPDDSESVKHYHLNNGGVTVELHRIAESLPGRNIDRRFQRWSLAHLLGDGLRKVEIEGAEVYLPPYGFDPVYVMNHAWHHFMNGGIGLRQVCDWTMYLHRYHKHVDVEELERTLHSFRLVKAWHLFAGIAVRHLGLPAEECPLYSGKYPELSDRMLDMILNEGNFGKDSDWHKSHRPEGYSKGKLHSLKWRTKRFIDNLKIDAGASARYYVAFLATGISSYFKGLR